MKRMVALLAVAALVAVGCGGDDDTASGGEGGELKKVRLGLSGSTLEFFFGFHVAQHLGYFEEEGLEVEITETGGSSEAAQLLAAGTFDVAQAVPEAALVAMQHEPLYPFYTYATQPFFDWYVTADSPIQEIADLEGTKIGIEAPEDGAVPASRYYLDQAGLDPDADVEFVVVGAEPASLIAAMEQGRIDSFTGSKQFLGPFATAGLDVRSIYPAEASEGGSPVEGLLATEEFANDEETLIGIGRAVAKGTLFCLNSKEACFNIIGEIRPESVADPEAARINLDAYLPSMTPPEEDGKYYFSPTTLSGWQDYFGIYSSEDVWAGDPPIEDPDAINLEELVIEDLRDEFNDFDYDAVIAESDEWASK
jgi:NitT/TauT family transport system substrate-binding protein